MPDGTVLLLASASPRRAELLTAAGIAFEVRPADVDERVREGEAGESYARRVAEEKARTAASLAPGRAVLAADTVVLVDDRILGKPGDASDARRMLRMLSDRSHEVLTAVSLAKPGPSGLRIDTEVEVTRVWFAALDTAEIDWYASTGEPLDKAGAYAVQGLASRYVTRIEGSYSNVVGLPVALVYQMCTRAGILLF